MTAPKLTAAQRKEMRDKRAKDAATVKLLVGRTIVKAEPNGSWEGEGMNGVWMHDWRLTLDDDTVVAFVTEEHPDVAPYGTDIILAGGRGSM